MKNANDIDMIHEKLNDLSFLLEEEELEHLFVKIHDDDGYGNKFDIAKYMLNHNEFQRAHEILLELSEKLKDRTDIYALLLSSFVMCNKHEEALQYHEKRKVYGKKVNYNLFKINGILKEYNRAYFNLQKANFNEKNDSFFLLNHLRLLVKCDRYEEARKILEILKGRINYFRTFKDFYPISHELNRYDFLLNQNDKFVDSAFKNAGNAKNLNKIKNDINKKNNDKTYFNNDFFKEHISSVKEKLKLSTPIDFKAIDIHLINFDEDIAVLHGVKTNQIEVQTVCNSNEIVKILVNNSYQRSMFELRGK